LASHATPSGIPLEPPTTEEDWCEAAGGGVMTDHCLGSASVVLIVTVAVIIVGKRRLHGKLEN
jgi:hypothetical protein